MALVSVMASHSGVSFWKIAEDNIACLYNFIAEEFTTICKFSPDGTRLVMESRNGASLWKVAEDNITCLHPFFLDEQIKISECVEFIFWMALS